MMVVDEWIEQTGDTSGHTTGQITSLHVDVPYSLLTIHDQVSATYGCASVDSGALVYYGMWNSRLNRYDVVAFGIHLGTCTNQAIFAPISNIELDFGKEFNLFQ